MNDLGTNSSQALRLFETCMHDNVLKKQGAHLNDLGTEPFWALRLFEKHTDSSLLGDQPTGNSSGFFIVQDDEQWHANNIFLDEKKRRYSSKRFARLADETMTAISQDDLNKPHCLVLNRDSPLYPYLQFRAVEKGIKKIKTYGTSTLSDIYLESYNYRVDHTDIKIVLGDEIKEYSLLTSEYENIVLTTALVTLCEAVGGNTDGLIEDFKHITFESMDNQYVGYISNVKRKHDPTESLTESALCRAVLMDRELKKSGYALFLFNPKYIRRKNAELEGYCIENKAFVKKTIPIPRLVGNWLSRSHSILNFGMGYKDFKVWLQIKKLDVCVPCDFSDLVTDKLATSRVINKIDTELHPRTEVYRHREGQLRRFIEKKGLVYIKPWQGNKGEGIFVVRPKGELFNVNYYKDSKKNVFEDLSLEGIVKVVEDIVDRQAYLIQEGIETKKYKDSSFDIRVIMLNDGEQWHRLYEVRVGAKDRDISNIAQGGDSFKLDKFLDELYDEEKKRKIIKQLIALSEKVANFLKSYYLHQLPELAFDFIMDKSGRLFLAEINSKPGMIITEEIRDVFNIENEERSDYKNNLLPHAECLAKFFKNRIESVSENSRQIWFSNIHQGVALDDAHKKLLMDYVIACIDKKEVDVPKFIKEDHVSRIFFMSVSDGKSPACVALGCGRGLLGAIESAISRLWVLFRENYHVAWVKLDLVTSVQPLGYPKSGDILDLDPSLEGIAFSDEIRDAFLPEQLVAHRFVTQEGRLKINRIVEFFSKDSRLFERFMTLEGKRNKLFKFQTLSLFSDRKELALLYRGHRTYYPLDCNALLNYAASGGEYLMRAISENGAFDYSYLPKQNQSKEQYNMLRHAGTTYSMLELYQFTKNPKIIDFADKAISYLLEHIKPIEINGVECAGVVEKGFVKLGGNALSILAMTKYIEVTGKKDHMPIIRKLASWIQETQAKNGCFSIHKQVYPNGKVSDFESGYYPGETLFALTRLYHLEKNDSWLHAAALGAKFLINIRDKGLKIEELEHDHWLLYALNELHRLKPNQIYLKHAKKISQAILNLQKRYSSHLDWIGSYYNPPRSTPTATRVEGLCASYQLSRDFGAKDDARNIFEAIERGVGFQLHTQFFPESAMYLSDPARVIGGFHRTLSNFEIRIDYVQHNISSLLAYHRLLGDAS